MIENLINSVRRMADTVDRLAKTLRGQSQEVADASRAGIDQACADLRRQIADLDRLVKEALQKVEAAEEMASPRTTNNLRIRPPQACIPLQAGRKPRPSAVQYPAHASPSVAFPLCNQLK